MIWLYYLGFFFEHIDHLRHVVMPVSKHGLKIKIRKCGFAKPQIELLRRIVDENELRSDPEKVKVIKHITFYTNVTKFGAFSK